VPQPRCTSRSDHRAGRWRTWSPGPVMVRTARSPGRRSSRVGADGMGNSWSTSADHGHLDGVAHPPLQAGHRGLRVPAGAGVLDGRVAARRAGYHLVSDGGTRPLRVHVRDPAS
jgi:NADH-quinone oxidoreductase subunit D